MNEPTLTVSPFKNRLDRLRARFDAAEIDALLVSMPESRFYLSGYTGEDQPPRDSAGYLLVTQQKALLLTDARTSEQAASESPDFEVVQYPSGVNGPKQIADSATSLGLRRLGFESLHVTYGLWSKISEHLGGAAALAPTDGLVDSLRLLKDAAEMRRLQDAIDVLDRCYADLLTRIRPGLTERETARIVNSYLLEHADGSSFPPIVASGPNGSMPHAVPSDRVIREGEGITIDIGARSSGYASDMTRTVSLGEPNDPKLREVFSVVLEAQETAERDARAGMTGKEIDQLARDVIVRAGYGEYFTHSLGHGIGLEVHEPPWVSSVRGTEPLAAGMVFSIEPGIYIPGWGGVRMEDLVQLDNDGARVLCHSPKNLVVA